MFDISKYYVFLIPIFIGSIIHLIKFVLFYFRHNRDLDYALEHGLTYGHMPSSHTGFAVSLITSVGYYEGISTGSFAVALALAIIIVDDAIRLRIQLGDQAKHMNKLAEELGLDPQKFPRLKERVGHKKIEVIIGAILGFFFTIWLIKFLEIYPITF